jgi:hypothetical protein
MKRIEEVWNDDGKQVEWNDMQVGWKTIEELWNNRQLE